MVVQLWKEQLKDPRFRGVCVVALVAFCGLMSVYPRFVNGIETRRGFAFPDPILSRIDPIDLTWPTFVVLYAAIVSTFAHLLHRPRVLAAGLLAYALMVLVRMAAMSLLPLDPPAGIIVLSDPFVELFGGGGRAVTRDLFFSGHTATMFLLYLHVQDQPRKLCLLGATVLVASFVLLQHVHYSVDVLAAPFFTFAACRASRAFVDRMVPARE